MKDLWFQFWNDRSVATLVLRTLALGIALWYFADPQTVKQWIFVLLGAGAVSIPAGQPNATPPKEGKP